MTTQTPTPDADRSRQMDVCWRAATDRPVGPVPRCDTPLLGWPLRLAEVKHRVLGHWGTPPGQSFSNVYRHHIVHASDVDVIDISSPRHGGPAGLRSAVLNGPHSQIRPAIRQGKAEPRKLFFRPWLLGDIPSHASLERPGSVYEGGELGDSICPSFEAALDRSDQRVACLVGDGHAATGHVVRQIPAQRDR